MRNSKKEEARDGSATTSAAVAVAIATVSEAAPLYEEGEAVIANHKGYYYLAKVEKVEFNKDWKYFIHYMGWNKSWDEWLGVNHLLKRTEENLKKVSHDTKKTNDKYAKIDRISQIQLDAPSGLGGTKLKNSSSLMSRKRKREHIGNKEKDNDSIEKLVNISIPLTLKKQLINDFELINHTDKLVRLPRTPNVDEIIEKYRDYRQKKESVIPESVGEVLSGLCIYFNKALPVLLLYNKERQQYQESIVEDISCPSPSAIYGAEHLLRLFVKLPALLYELNIEEETLRVLQQILLDFLKFLQKNQSMFCLSSYA
ncbi:hypothetical protein vseg_012469 [Gypsophila vaccaria]